MSSFDPAGLTVYVDGDYVDGAEARLSVFDHGVLYGDGVFEGMRVFGGALFRPLDHLARLERSARTIGLEIPLPPAELLDVIREVVARSGLEDAHVRPIVTRGIRLAGNRPVALRPAEPRRHGVPVPADARHRPAAAPDRLGRSGRRRGRSART